jgi:hypothetical protein
MNRIEKFTELSKRFPSLIPLDGKRPIEKGWQKWCREPRKFDPKEFEGRNAGIPCGPVNGIPVLDIDDFKAFKAFRERELRGARPTYWVKTGGKGFVQMKKNMKKCSLACGVLNNYRSHFLFPVRPWRPHPVNECICLLEIGTEDFWLSLCGFPDNPKNKEDFEKMINGKKWMPLPLEVHIWRKLFRHYWTLR